MLWLVVGFVILSFALGAGMMFRVRGQADQFMVCGRMLPFWVVGMMLSAPAVDGNASLGNAMLSATRGPWAGLVIPLGLSLSLVLTGKFLAPRLHRLRLLSLPDYFGQRYGKSTEVLVSAVAIVSFGILLAGNLAALGWIASAITGFGYGQALAAMTVVIAGYTIAGGLLSAVWTSLVQVIAALVGFWLLLAWTAIAAGPGELAAAWGRVTAGGMVSASAGALGNWASLLALAFGNTMALDFMQRVFSAKSPVAASRACYLAAGLAVVGGIPATAIGLLYSGAIPSEPRMLLPLAAAAAPTAIGALALIGIIGPSMATASGAILVTSIAAFRNVIGRLGRPMTDRQLLAGIRWLAVPMATAAAVFAWVRPDPGVLLVLAFDVLLAGCVVPLVLGLYWHRGTSRAAVSCVAVGTGMRLALELMLPASLAGLETMLPPLVGLITYVAVSLVSGPAVKSQMVDE